MENSDQMKLDTRFDQMLVEMKPHVLRLPHKAERQKCALWIKKFCEPTIGVSGRKNRNMYAQLLVHLLKKGSLEGPFIQKPSNGPLPPLPSYTSIYFDDMKHNVHFGAKENIIPDWVNGELGSDVTALSAIAVEPPTIPTVGLHDSNERPLPFSSHRLPNKVEFVSSELTSPRRFDNFTPPRPMHYTQEPAPKEPRGIFTMSSDDETTTNAENTRIDSLPSPAKLDVNDEWKNPFSLMTTATTSMGSTFRDEPVPSKAHQRELDMQMKMAQVKLQEEKLKMQQRHDANVQQILDRKNNELEELKNHYQNKSKEQEELLLKLEKKVNQLQRELSSVREKKDKQINNLKKMAEDASLDKQQEFEKRLHEATAAFEQEKFSQQKQHTRNIQELLDDTNSRLLKMEQQYAQQTESTTAVIRELECRVQQLSCEEEQLGRQRAAAEQGRAEMEARCERLQTQLANSNARSTFLEKDLKREQTERAEEVRSLKVKCEAEMTSLKQENAQACLKAADTISDLEQHVAQLKVDLETAEAERQKQIQVRNMQQESDQTEETLHEKIRKLEQKLGVKEREVTQLTEQLRVQTQEAEHVLECFKKQVEISSGQMCDDVRKQMEAVEADLSQSKELREKQMREFQRQLADEKLKYEHKMAELQAGWQQDRGRLVQQLSSQREEMLTQHEQELARQQERGRQDVEEVEKRAHDRQERDAQLISELEQQCQSLRDEVLQGSQLRKQQLMELGLLREQEKRDMARQHENELTQLKSLTEEQRLELEKKHNAEVEQVLERTNDRLKEIEKEYDVRNLKTNENVGVLQNTITQLREDLNRQAEQSEHRLLEKNNQLDTEKRKLKQQHAISIMSLQHDVEEQRGRVRQLERRLSQQEQDQQEKIGKLRSEHETRLRGLIPASVRQELEDTISSLRLQVNSLQQRATVLQEELTARNDYQESNAVLLGGGSTSNTLIESSISLKSS